MSTDSAGILSSTTSITVSRTVTDLSTGKHLAQVEFFNKELNESFMTQITNVTHHSTFEDMIKSNGLEKVLPGIRTIDEGVQVYMQYYTKEIEAEFGVVGIHIKLL